VSAAQAEFYQLRPDETGDVLNRFVGRPRAAAGN